jgi:hypothetical protein
MAVIAALLAVTALGAGVVRLWLRGPMPAAALWGLSGLVGFAAWGWLTHVSLALFDRVVPAVWLPAVPLALFGAVRLARTRPRLPRPGLAALPALALLAWELAYLVGAAASTRLGWDGLFIWALKAKALHLDVTAQPGAYVAHLAGAWAVPHVEYPVALPALEAWLHVARGGVNETALKALGPAFLLALLAVLGTALRRRLEPAGALTLLALLVTTPALVFVSTTGYADLPLAALFTAAALFALEALEGAGRRSETIAAALAASLALVKREGALLGAELVVLLAVALALRHGVGRAARFLAAAVPVALVVAGPWFLFAARHDLVGKDFLPVSVGTLWANVDRLPALAVMLADVLVRPGVFGFLWPAVALTGALRWRGWRRPGARFLGALILAALAVDAGVFVFSGVNPYTVHVISALDRLVLHAAPVAVLLAGLLLAEGRDDPFVAPDRGPA